MMSLKGYESRARARRSTEGSAAEDRQDTGPRSQAEGLAFPLATSPVNLVGAQKVAI